MQGVVERKNTIPILSNILLKAADGHLSFTSTDLDLTLLSAGRGQRLAPGQRDGSGAEALRPDPQPSRGRRRAEADGQPLPRRDLPAVELPPRGAAGRGLPDGPEGGREEGRLRSPWISGRRLTRKVLYAVSAEETRFQLMGALLKDKGKEFELVATDGHRLALDEFREGRREGDPPQRPDPKKALAEILKMDGGEKRDLEIRHSENHLLFTVGEPPAHRAPSRRELSRLRKDPVQGQRPRRARAARRLPGRDPPRRALFLGALARRQALLREEPPDDRLGEPGARRRNRDARRRVSTASRSRSD